MATVHDFVEGPLPAGYHFAFPPALYNREEYRKLHGRGKWRSFYVMNVSRRTVDGHVHFYVDEGHALSPFRAPFGSFEFAPQLPPVTIRAFIAYVESQLRTDGVVSIRIKNPPRAYQAEQIDLLESLLLNSGYGVAEAEITSAIPVSQTPFGGLLHPRKRRKLRQSDAGALTFVQPANDMIGEVYAFIASRRAQKKYCLSVTEDELQGALRALPAQYQMFAVYDGARMVAASVAARSRQNVLYHFISDHLRSAGQSYPALKLMEGIYNFCRDEGIELLDLGTSMTPQGPDFSLMKFKSELGGKPVAKLTLNKKLS